MSPIDVLASALLFADQTPDTVPTARATARSVAAVLTDDRIVACAVAALRDAGLDSLSSVLGPEDLADIARVVLASVASPTT